MCGIWLYLSKHPNITKDVSMLYNSFNKIKHRGPDYNTLTKINNRTLLGFHRLSINNLTVSGNQPFMYNTSYFDKLYSVCNGEIYNYKNIDKKYRLKSSRGDCEVIPLMYKNGVKHLEMMNELGSEYATIIVNDSLLSQNNIKLLVGRDPLGVRQLYYAEDGDSIAVSSELKGLSDIYDEVRIFPPNHYMIFNSEDNMKKFINYNPTLYAEREPINKNNREDIREDIRKLLIKAVQKRLMSDVPVGALLSGGLDSSLVVGIMKYINPNIKYDVFTATFNDEGSDIKYAREMSKKMELNHHIVNIDVEKLLKTFEEVIYTIESWDTTTVRASMLQLCVAKYIKENTDIKALLTAELSDELFAGYMYSHNAPNEYVLKQDTKRLVRDVHMFDGLRVDKTMSSQGLEARLPFADIDLVKYVLKLDDDMISPKMFYGKKMEKELLRKSFDNMDIIPKSILMRHKEAFSDGTSSVKNPFHIIIKDYIDNIITNEEFQKNREKVGEPIPMTKESYYYRKLFVEMFGKSNINVINGYWMPKWSGNINDPSARVLNVYKNN